MARTRFLQVAALWIALSGAAFAADRLPSFSVDSSQTSVSGLSSGAFMAVQFHTAFSADIMGAGVVAGGPYNCAFVNLGYFETCMHGQPMASNSVASARWFASVGQIDPVDNLRRSRIYLFSGTKDETVMPAVVAAAYDYYRQLGVPAANVSYVKTVPAGHAFIAPGATGACATTDIPYINHCSYEGAEYDQAGAILTQLYGPLSKPSTNPTGRLVSFDQTLFEGAGLADAGFLYVPQSCDAGATCRIHVAFHGCRQTPTDIGNKFYTDAGYNAWADTNKILILYPQVASDLATNPKHCWDWFGYTGPFFHLKAGAQMSGVKAMIDQLGRR